SWRRRRTRSWCRRSSPGDAASFPRCCSCSASRFGRRPPASATDAAEAPAAARAADGDDSEGDAAAAEDEEEEGIGEEETAEAVARRIYDNFQRTECPELFGCSHSRTTPSRIIRSSPPGSRLSCVSTAPNEEVPNSDSQPASASQAEAQSQKLRVQAWTDRLKDIYMVGGLRQIAKQQTLIACLAARAAAVCGARSSPPPVPFVVAMLGSSTQSDILEAVPSCWPATSRAWPSARARLQEDAGPGLVQGGAIKQAVVSAYEKMYTEVFVDQDAGIGPDESEKLRVSPSLEPADLLRKPVWRCLLSLGETRLPMFVRPPAHRQKACVQGAWDKFARRAGNSSQDRRAAVILLGMMAAEEPGIVRAKHQQLLRGPLRRLHRPAAGAVHLRGPPADGRHAGQKPNLPPMPPLAPASLPPESCRMPTESDLFQRLLDIIVSSASGESRFWMPMMEQAVSVIYTLADSPDQLAASLIRRMARLLLDCSRRKSVTAAAAAATAEPADAIQLDDADAEAADAAVEMSDDGPEAPQPSLTLASSMLAKFVALVGHVALKVLVHLEVAVLAELKRRTALKEANKGGETGRASAVKASKRKVFTGGASADDQEAEQIRRLLDDVLLYDERHLLSHLAPLIVHVCEQPASFQSEQLQAAASLALAKLMLVSGKFCEQHLGLLFTLAEKSQSEVIRANLIVALGDLAKRLYGRLRDSSARVRLNALNTLSHLILNDMIKVKGQISEMTTCICDSQSRIAHLAKLFFSELSNKGNALYNVLPDIINRLSDAETHEDHFKVTRDAPEINCRTSHI
uniref:Cnd1 domain-containing protein n=1 Tax=Macrostomum lignano TaxID=282301 RepID=A0A1I8FD89_9PLAT